MIRAAQLCIVTLAVLALSCCTPVRKSVKFHDALTPAEHLELARSYDAQGLKEKAAENYKAAVSGKDTEVPAWMGLGNLAFNDKNYKAAEDYFKRVLKRDPDHGGANNNLAMTYLAQSTHLDLAEKYAKRAAESPAYRVYAEDTLEQIRRKKESM